MEQREGRINRFKCLAIRQNVADKYGKADGITFKRDIWTEMFEAAKAEKQNDQSELVPFWCFGKNQSVKIERLLKDLFEKLGFQRKDLKTVYFNVDTEYESYQDRDKSWKRRFKGYKYNHHMKIEFAADNKRLGQVLYALAHSSLRPEFSIEYTVADVEKCKNELLHKAIEDSIQKAQVLTTAANVKLGEIQAIDYSWGEIDFVTKPLNEMRLMECTECEMSAPGAYDIDIEADDINVTDTATVIWEIA
ncbi:SIMPL domain-containing protein [Bariatricus sp. HCP28S3_C2]|uniref:SIMPL domain-containing protein n=1 Tax=unclassified Bariatricus TaxID=2677046 RepID=UPI003F8BC235